MISDWTPTKKGSELCTSDRLYVLNAYVHRFTGDHKPQWARRPWKDGKPFPLQFKDDNDWLEHSMFAVRKDGRLDMRHHACESFPTWPDNPELRK